ncbi:hypothetical protein GGR57DRAFT_513063 [Xylariaceae sp. FL1272]|nr:hypothetical protein GGR57DRAFT_513063 [Xylariaceae sp. FL1272]
MAPIEFDTTPETQNSFPRYLYRQIATRPQKADGLDLSCITALVTGSNSGVGLETSRQLFELGVSKPILAVRSQEKDEAAAKDLATARKDLSSDAIETLTRLDIAVLNEGICPAKRTVNATTGHDQIIQAVRNRQPSPTRIILTLSETGAWTSFPVGKETPILEALAAPGKASDNTTDRMVVSKLLGQYFVSAVAPRVPPSVATINGASPGAIGDSQLDRDLIDTPCFASVKSIQRAIAFTSAVGARLITDAAVRHGEKSHGQFLSFQKIVPFIMATVIYIDEGKAILEQLWAETMSELWFARVEDIIREVNDEDIIGFV